ncbi:MAG: hypothetical protein CL609_16960 [Anaerolineaceae bacterium]|nr:hypothetical protein [Anaerolineaceae bacterium]
MRKIILSLLILILLVSCNYKNLYAVKYTMITDTFLNERMCNLPCWQNITPGVTSYAEGMKYIIKSFDLAENFDLDEVKGSEELGSAFLWDFIKLDPSTTVNDRGVIRKEGYEDVISSMRFSFHYSFMSLQDLVNLYGEPDQVAFSLGFNAHPPHTKIYLIDLIYDEENTMITVYTFEKRSKLIIDENAIVLNIIITEKNTIQEWVLNSYQKVVDWEGYGDYAFFLEFE